MSRALDWEGCLNVRDLGGVPLDGGGETRYGAFVRADDLGRLTDHGWRSLQGHGVTRVVDLRWPEERARDAPRDVEVEVVHISLLGRFDPARVDDIHEYMAVDDPAGYWGSQYVSILEEHRLEFGRAFEALAVERDGAVVFHCAAGKDRTGLVAALLLRLAGVSIADAAHDYSLTFDLLGRGPREWVNAARDEDEWRRRMFMQHTPAEAMERALSALEEANGSVEAYLRTAGLTARALDTVRSRLAAA